MVRVLENAGHRVLRTDNEAHARLANRVVIEITHATYGVGYEPLEAVVSIRPAVGNVIVFEISEGPQGEDQDDALSGGPDAPATSGRTRP